MLAVLSARDVADVGAPTFTLAEVRSEWEASDLDLASDTRVVEAADGSLTAYGIIRPFGSLALVVPAAEGQGIGARLLRWVEERERERDERPHRQLIGATNQRAAALLTGAGYARVRTYSRMERTLTHADRTPPPRLPNPYAIRTLDPENDAETIHALDRISFAANADYTPESLEQFRQQHLAAHDTAPDLSRVVTAGSEPVAFLLTRRWDHEAVGFIDLLAVHPDHRRHTLATTFLRVAFHDFARAGLRKAGLGVASDNPRALRLYERVGMSAAFQHDVYERPLRA